MRRRWTAVAVGALAVLGLGVWIDGGSGSDTLGATGTDSWRNGEVLVSC
jgi:hypothetical protein